MIEGTVDNGRTAAVAFGSIRCTAGVRDRTSGSIEIAFFGKAPSKLPLNGTVDGMAYQVVDAWRSQTVREMAVMLAKPVDG